ncbi:hypothetical protein PHLH4_11580 [Pseudomonas sp. St316]|nr:hypothetical protein PHLH4_11580 [Pseudomonas sp. St316]
MYKTIMFVTAMVVAALNPSWVLAVDDAHAAIHITANIPNKQFHVVPRDPDFGKNEVMHFDPVTRKLSPVRQLFDVKHTDGSVHAYVERTPVLYGKYLIPLLVAFNNVYLYESPQEVVDDATSTPGMTAEMLIYTPFPVSSKHTGLYVGDITVIFDAVPRVTL